MNLWLRHPGVRTGEQLTLGERAADRVRNGMGSWPFVGTAAGFLVGWIATRGLGSDPAPYILLNLCLSMLAAMQGSILLIAAKRADQVAAEVAHHTLTNTDRLLAALKVVNDQSVDDAEDANAG